MNVYVCVCSGIIEPQPLYYTSMYCYDDGDAEKGTQFQQFILVSKTFEVLRNQCITIIFGDRIERPENLVKVKQLSTHQI